MAGSIGCVGCSLSFMYFANKVGMIAFLPSTVSANQY